MSGTVLGTQAANERSDIIATLLKLMSEGIDSRLIVKQIKYIIMSIILIMRKINMTLW